MPGTSLFLPRRREARTIVPRCLTGIRTMPALHRWTIAALAAVLAALACGCTSVSEIRTHHGAGNVVPIIDAERPSLGCEDTGATDAAFANSVEDYDAFWAAYVEMDDEGWLYRLPGQPSQLQVLHDRLRQELSDPARADVDFLVVAFIHGWHHNAHDNDCNVHEFRALLKVAAQRYQAAFDAGVLKHRRRIVGVYVGWRGESIDIENVSVATVLDRRNAAERVAKGDVREVFAQLRKLQIGESMKPQWRADRMRTVVVGHSFGGLVAFNGLSPAILNELTLTKPEPGPDGCHPTVYRRPAIDIAAAAGTAAPEDRSAPVFPDQLVLINPAFEATRFESLHQLMRPGPPGCEYPPDRPKMIVVTADNDSATGPIFTFGRQFLTLLQAGPRGDDPQHAIDEREAGIHAIGFTPRYVTHRLCLLPQPGGGWRAVAALTPPAHPDWRPDPYAPIWVVGAPPEIVDNHNGFFFAKPVAPGAKQEPWLLNWLVTLHTFGPGPASPAMTGENGCTR